MTMPLEDFRFLLQGVKLDRRQRVHWPSFLAVFDEHGHHHSHSHAMKPASKHDPQSAMHDAFESSNNESFSSSYNTNPNPPTEQKTSSLNKHLKKCWIRVLKFCQKCDQGRTGKVTIHEFAEAMDINGINKVNCI